MAFQQKVLKECTKILLEIENESSEDRDNKAEMESEQFEHMLEERYSIYKQRKQSQNMEVLPRHEFVAACAITAERQNENSHFLFEKTKLSFTIMCSNCDTHSEPMVNIKQFEKWATKLYPLATKQNYKRIFLALASDITEENKSETKDDEDGSRKGSFGRLRQRVADYKQNSKAKTASNANLKEANTSKHVKLHYGGVTMHRFCGYVNELFNNFNIEQNECATVKLSLENHISKHERILYHIRGVSDMTGLPPYYGFVILTDYHLIFQGTALTTRTTAIKLSDTKLCIERAKIGGFLKRDTALKVCCEHGEFLWNVVNIKNRRRDQLFWSVWTCIKAHELAENVSVILNENQRKNNDKIGTISDELIMKIKRKIIVECADDILRQNSLQNIFEKQRFDAVPFVRYATTSQKRKYVCAICDELTDFEYTQNAAKSRIFGSLFTGIYNSESNQNKSENKFIDPDTEIKLQKYKKLQTDFERENTAKKLDALVVRKREEFDIKDFFKYLKILRIESEPLMFGYRMYKCIIGWKNKGLSLLILLCLECVAYLDLVCYIPAFLLIANGVLLISFKNDTNYTLQCFDNALMICGFDPDEFDQERLAAQAYANQKYGSGVGELTENKHKNKKNKWQFMHKLKVARYKYYYNSFAMGFHQKKLAILSVFLGRFRTIYKWEMIDKSQIFCLFNIVLGIILIFAPLRYVFGIAVFGLFFKHSPFRDSKRKNRKGIVDRYWEGIPPDIPDIHDSDSEDSSEESVDESESDSDRNGKIMHKKVSKRTRTTKKRTSSNGSAGLRSSDDTS